MKKVAIIIRSHNEQFWIGKLLQKIKDQSEKSFEVILVDNCSNDQTVNIFKKFHPKGKVLSINKFNPGKAINIGIQNSKSEFIIIISAHCIPKSNQWISNLIRNLKDDNVVACYGRQLPLSSSTASDTRDLLNTFGVEKRIQKKDTFFHNANSAIKRSFWIKNKFNEKIDHIEDRIWARKVIDAGKRIIYDPEAAVYHYHGINHSSNMSRVNKISSILKNNDDFDYSKLPSFMQFKESKTLFCILGHDKSSNEKFKKIKSKLNSIKANKKIFVYSELMKTSKENNNLIFYPRKINYNKFTFIKILKKLLLNSYKKNFFPDCLVYINLHNKNLSISKIIASTKIFYSGMYDSVFFGREEFRQMWIENENAYQPVDINFLPKNLKTPSYLAEYGMGLATSPILIDQEKIVGEKIAIIRI